jgi:DNA-binding NtrC family response regulator
VAQIIIATQDENLRESLSTQLLEGGHAVASVSTWPGLVEGLAQRDARLVLLDAESAPMTLQGRAGSLLQELAGTMPAGLQIRVVRGELPPLEGLPLHRHTLTRLARRLAGPAVPKDELKLLQLLGVGPRPLSALAKLARSPLPVAVVGERGTGKMRVAKAIHRLGGGGPFITLKAPGSSSTLEGDVPETEPDMGAGRGTLYLPLQDGWPHERVLDVCNRAGRQGWRVIAGTRQPLPGGFGQWALLQLWPLRERPDELHRLTLYYLDLHRKALGLPRRRLGKGTWALVHSYTWPRNARELETFVLSLLSAVDRSLVLPRHLPPELRRLVEPATDAAALGAAAAVEDLVQAPIRRVVDLYEPGGDLTLHRLVLDGAERPLLRAVLARTGGNRKAAATLLGLSRNTLKVHERRLLGGGTG